MTREEETSKAAEKELKDCPYINTSLIGFDFFIKGAEWADQHPHWISVEEELPEVGVAVLTITPRGTQRVGFYEDGWWLANYIDLVRMGSITHWMPLPQAPKEGGKQ